MVLVVLFISAVDVVELVTVVFVVVGSMAEVEVMGWLLVEVAVVDEDVATVTNALSSLP